MQHVTLPRNILNQILEQVRQSPDREICGLISSRGQLPTRCFPISNIDKNAERHFLLDPKQQINAMRRMRDAGESLFAIYHSHPDGPPEPSQEDIDKVTYPDALYLIISPSTNGGLQINGYYLRKEEACPVDITIE